MGPYGSSVQIIGIWHYNNELLVDYVKVRRRNEEFLATPTELHLVISL